jgi:guanylate kinase
MDSGKLIILSAPSGAGKTTIMKQVVETFPQLEFSISATSRAPRGEECYGVDYYFVTAEQFMADVDAGAFVEWEEVYGGIHYGTLRAEVERIWGNGNTIIFDVDVKGGVKLKSIFGDRALSIFIMPPSVDELRKRLTQRGTDSSEAIEKRIAKAEHEICYAPQFDLTVVNDVLDSAVAKIERAIGDFLNYHNS